MGRTGYTDGSYGVYGFLGQGQLVFDPYSHVVETKTKSIFNSDSVLTRV